MSCRATAFLLFFALILAPSLASAQEGIITTLAGTGTAGFSGDGGSAILAQLNAPHGIGFDSVGNLYIADVENNRVRKVDTGGTITTYAGSGPVGPPWGICSGDGGSATQARLSYPWAVALDPAGNFYIADNKCHRVRKVDGSGVISTYAGNGTSEGDRGYGGDGGPAPQARLNYPGGLAIDNSGNLYIADTANNRVRKVDISGTITTVAGTGSAGYSGDGGQATQAQLNQPHYVATDSAGNLYIADTLNHRVRKVSPNGIISTVAGIGAAGFSGDGGQATQAQLNQPIGIAFQGSSLYFVDSQNHRVRKVDASGTISTVAGNGTSGFSGDGGSATQAQLNAPLGVAVDNAGNLYIGDKNNLRVRKVTFATTGTISGAVTNSSTSSGISGAVVSTTSGGYRATTDSSGNYTISNVPTGTYTAVASANGYSSASQAGVSVSSGATTTVNLSLLQAFITTVAGTGTAGFSGDGGPATLAQFNTPVDVAVDSAGYLYIADNTNHRIRKVDPTGTITTVAGNGISGYSGDGGPATQAQLYDPADVAIDTAGNLYIADQYNERVRKVDTSGTITTIAGTGSRGFSGNGVPATQAQLNHPLGVSLDNSGNMYIADYGNNRIRKVDSNGIITTVAGSGTAGYSADGGPATQAQLNHPYISDVDSEGNLYIADAHNHRVRKVDSSGIITTVAGSGPGWPQSEGGFGGDGGPATQALFSYTTGIAIDSARNLYIVDSYGNRIRRVDAGGIITTVAGSGPTGPGTGSFGGDGGPAVQARINNPNKITVDSAGNLYIAENASLRVRKVTFGQPTTGTISGTVTNASTGAAISGATVSTSTGGYSATTGSNGSYTISNVAAGTYIVTASASGYQSASQTGVSVTAGGTVTQNFSLTPNPAISLSPASLTFSAQQAGSNPVDQTVTVTNSGGGTLSWTASDNAAWLTLSPSSGSASAGSSSSLTASVSISGLSVATRTATITVSSTNATNSPQTVSVTLNVTTAPPATLQSISVSPSSATLTSAGATQQLTATGTYSDNTTQTVTSQVTWTSSNASAATVSASGLVTAVANGTATITASLSGRSATATVTVNITVTTPPSGQVASLSVTPSSLTLTGAGQTAQLQATATVGGATQTVTASASWSSSNSSVASVSGGLVTAASNGTATVTATYSGVSSSATITVSITPPGQDLVIIEVEPDSVNITVRGSWDLRATGQYRDGSERDLTSSVTWSSSNELIATVSSSGRVTGVNIGMTSITAQSGSIMGSTFVTVGLSPPQHISITPTEATLTSAGQTFDFRAVGYSADGSQQYPVTDSVEWSSSDSAVATVRAGRVTAVGPGEATVTARLNDLEATAEVEVTINRQPVISGMGTQEAVVGRAFSYRVPASDPDGDALRFSLIMSPPRGMAIDSSTGVITWVPEASHAGTSGAFVDVEDGRGGRAESFLTIRVSILAPAITTFSPASGPAGTLVTIEGENFLPTPSQNSVTFNGVPATVTQATAISLSARVPAGATTGIIAVTTAGGTATSIDSFTVEVSPIGITASPQEITLNRPGQTVQVTVQGNFSDGSSRDVTGSSIFSSTDPTVAQVSETGLVGYLRNGSAAIEITNGELSERVTVTVDIHIPVRGTARVRPQVIMAGFDPTLMDRGDDRFDVIAMVRPGAAPVRAVTINQNESEFSVRMGHAYTLDNGDQLWRTTYSFPRGAFGDMVFRALWGDEPGEFNIAVIDEGQGRHSFPDLEFGNTPSPPGEVLSPMAEPDLAAGLKRLRPQVLAAGFSPAIIDLSDDHFDILALVRAGAVPIRAVPTQPPYTKGHSKHVGEGDMPIRAVTLTQNQGTFRFTMERDEELPNGDQLWRATFNYQRGSIPSHIFRALWGDQPGEFNVSVIDEAQGRHSFPDLEFGDNPALEEAAERPEPSAPPAPEVPAGGQMTATIDGERLESTALIIAADELFIYIQGHFQDGSVLRLAVVRDLVEGEELPLSLGPRAFDPNETLYVDAEGARHFLEASASGNNMNLLRYGVVGEAVAGTFRLSFEDAIEVSGRFDGTRGADQTLPQP